MTAQPPYILSRPRMDLHRCPEKAVCARHKAVISTAVPKRRCAPDVSINVHTNRRVPRLSLVPADKAVISTAVPKRRCAPDVSVHVHTNRRVPRLSLVPADKAVPARSVSLLKGPTPRLTILKMPWHRYDPALMHVYGPSNIPRHQQLLKRRFNPEDCNTARFTFKNHASRTDPPPNRSSAILQQGQFPPQHPREKQLGKQKHTLACAQNENPATVQSESPIPADNRLQHGIATALRRGPKTPCYQPEEHSKTPGSFYNLPPTSTVFGYHLHSSSTFQSVPEADADSAIKTREIPRRKQQQQSPHRHRKQWRSIHSKTNKPAAALSLATPASHTSRHRQSGTPSVPDWLVLLASIPTKWCPSSGSMPEQQTPSDKMVPLVPCSAEQPIPTDKMVLFALRSAEQPIATDKMAPPGLTPGGADDTLQIMAPSAPVWQSRRHTANHGSVPPGPGQSPEKAAPPTTTTFEEANDPPAESTPSAADPATERRRGLSKAPTLPVSQRKVATHDRSPSIQQQCMVRL
ncbi:hypothetical protein EDC01DRAFT_784021 [Geopyxis carbonaria]|nr:hypothetical protein EDC01DRAFT_784021 [Geopyxis carbonaria]